MSDPVEIGIKEWQKCRDAAAEALAACDKAKRDVEYYRGQYDLLAEQKARDAETIRRLQQQVDEADLALAAFAAGVLDIIQKRKQGGFRKMATPTENGNAKPALTSSALEDDLRDIASHINKAKPVALRGN